MEFPDYIQFQCALLCHGCAKNYYTWKDAPGWNWMHLRFGRLGYRAEYFRCKANMIRETYEKEKYAIRN